MSHEDAHTATDQYQPSPIQFRVASGLRWFKLSSSIGETMLQGVCKYQVDCVIIYSEKVVL